MKRLTTDNPQNNVETMLNYAYADDNEVVLRYGEHDDQRLCAYIAHRAKVLCDCEMSPDEIMKGACIECEHDCALGILNTVAIQAAELRSRLKPIEDILGDDYDLDRLRKLVEADREGRVVVIPCKVGDTIFAVSQEKVRELMAVSVAYFLSEVTNHMTINAQNSRGAIISIEPWQFGKTVFLTSEEAEAAMERMKSDG